MLVQLSPAWRIVVFRIRCCSSRKRRKIFSRLLAAMQPLCHLTAKLAGQGRKSFQLPIFSRRRVLWRHWTQPRCLCGISTLLLRAMFLLKLSNLWMVSSPLVSRLKLIQRSLVRYLVWALDFLNSGARLRLRLPSLQWMAMS